MRYRYGTAGAVGALALALAPVLAPGSASLRGQGQGERLSPLDSVTARVEGATLEVQYGRPSMRGRLIFGDLVPYDRVWRTGANEATHFRADADLEIGDAEVPAGHYTLYTIPRPDGWTLIVNRQTGQWGTQYDPERDLARIPMEVERINRPVETFTISIEPVADTGAATGEEEDEEEDRDEEGMVAGADAAEEVDGWLSMEWERTRARVPIRVIGGAAPADSAGGSSDREGGLNE